MQPAYAKLLKPKVDSNIHFCIDNEHMFAIFLWVSVKSYDGFPNKSKKKIISLGIMKYVHTNIYVHTYEKIYLTIPTT